MKAINIFPIWILQSPGTAEASGTNEPQAVRPTSICPYLVDIDNPHNYTNWGWILLVTIAGSYLVTNLGASLITAVRKGWKHLPLLPIAYAIIHLSYGLGFLAGLLKF